MPESHTIIGRHLKNSRKVIATVGKRYRVDPLNKAKRKHLGRTGVIEAFEEGFHPQVALIRFDDTNRIVKVQIVDLVEE